VGPGDGGVGDGGVGDGGVGDGGVGDGGVGDGGVGDGGVGDPGVGDGGVEPGGGAESPPLEPHAAATLAKPSERKAARTHRRRPPSTVSERSGPQPCASSVMVFR
jgi:hypothetical protein